MSVRSELGARRLVLALAAVLVLPTTLAVAAARYEPPTAPPTATALSHDPLPQAPDALAVAERERNQHAQRVAARLTTARLVPPERLDEALTGPAAPGALPTLVLAPREQPWTLDELVAAVPAAFTTAGDALVVQAHLAVPAGAVLQVTTATPDVRLVSGAQGFATLVSRGTVDVVGTAEQKISISSFDPATGRPDTETVDGRAFVQEIGGRMDVAHASFDRLGFGTGTTSGVAWKGINSGSGSPHVSARGDVSDSTFSRNRFGVYTMEAHAMRFTGNTFVDNDLYGFDPHDFSDAFVVKDNVAHGNGKHGFIFSRGCDGNLLEGNLSYDNEGHGFMIDDGRTEALSFAEARVNTSDDNRLVGNVARDNAGSGVEVEGGTGNVVEDNRLEGNYVGVRLKNGAVASVVGNTLVDNVRYGVDVLPTAEHADITGNDVRGGWAGVNVGARGVATLEDNTVRGVSAETVVAGQAAREHGVVERVARYLRWNPVLVLWGLILGVPLMVAGARALRGARPSWSRRPVAAPSR